jgi:tetratricopeptide (TPR) repeat protein
MKKLIALLMLCTALPLAAQTQKSLTDKAMEYVQKDSLPQAEKLYKQAIAATKDTKQTVALYYSLALIQRQMKHYPDAIDSFTSALKAEPKSTALLLKRAALYLEQGLDATAMADYNQALLLEPDNKEALAVRAYLLSRRGELDKAQADYTHLKVLEPNNFNARLGLALLAQKKKDFRSAMEQLNTLISEYGNNAALYLARANVEMDIVHPELALIDVERSITLDSSVPEAYILRGDIHLRLKKKILAQQDYMRALKAGASQAEIRPRLQKCR